MPKKAGTIPFQFSDGSVRICLVSSKKRDDTFVLPKGTVRASEKAAAAALRETFEEAGLKGQLSKKGIKIKAESADPDSKTNTIKFFPMLVDSIADHWPEQPLRKRLWVDIKALPLDKMITRDIDVINAKKINDLIKAMCQQSAA